MLYWYSSQEKIVYLIKGIKSSSKFFCKQFIGKQCIKKGKTWALQKLFIFGNIYFLWYLLFHFHWTRVIMFLCNHLITLFFLFFLHSSAHPSYNLFNLSTLHKRIAPKLKIGQFEKESFRFIIIFIINNFEIFHNCNTKYIHMNNLVKSSYKNSIFNKTNDRIAQKIFKYLSKILQKIK